MNEGLRSLRLLKVSKPIVLSLRTSIEHLSDFFNKVLKWESGETVALYAGFFLFYLSIFWDKNAILWYNNYS